MSPQLTSASVSVTTCVIAGIISAHLDSVQPWPPPPPPRERHISLLMLSLIEPDRSSRIRMSGATFIAVLLRAPQLASGVEFPARGRCRRRGVVGETTEPVYRRHK